MSEREIDGDSDEQPSIDDEEMADFGAVAEEIEASADGDVDGQDDVDGDGADPALEENDDRLSPDDVGDRLSVGDIYCNALGMGAAVSRVRLGSADEDQRRELVEEYGDMARQLQIDEYLDQWLEEHGGMDEIGPGQALVLSTLIFGGAVMMDDPDMIENIGAEVDG